MKTEIELWDELFNKVNEYKEDKENITKKRYWASSGSLSSKTWTISGSTIWTSAGSGFCIGS